MLVGRMMATLSMWPLIFINPALTGFGIVGLVPLLTVMVLLQVFYRRLSMRMEKRTDQIAIENQREEGIYARALEKLHENNRGPAVNPSNLRTHPHLYDRMLAAGITPDYPRPQAPKRLTWVGVVYLGTLVLLSIAHYVSIN